MDKKESSIVTVRVVTKVGDVHLFPGMDRHALKIVLPKNGRVSQSVSSLALVNVSTCVLSMPFDIIRRIDVDGEEWWCCPA